VPSDPLVPRTLQRLRRTDSAAARRASEALAELLADGGLADLTQHDLQTYLWFTLPDSPEPLPTASALGLFFELAQLNRYAGIALSGQTATILRTYAEQGHAAGVKTATRAMEASGVVPPDLAELDWGTVMGPAESTTFDRIAATLELALAAGDLKPGGRGWRVAQQRLTRQQLTMKRPDGPPLLDRIRDERISMWAEAGGHARRALTSAVLSGIAIEAAPPADLAGPLAPMRWLLDLAGGRAGDTAGAPLTVTGNLSRRVVQEAAERFVWWEPSPSRPPRSEGEVWQLGELRLLLQRAGAVRRSGRRLVLGARGRSLLGDPDAQWRTVTALLMDQGDFESAAQESALMLLLQAHGMAESRELIKEVAEVLASSGWRDVTDGSPPDDNDVMRAVWATMRRCQLWGFAQETDGPGFTTRHRLTAPGRLAATAALRAHALRPRLEER
jgi:hypothetical protein